MNKIKKIFGNIAALGSTLALGALSFSGMLLLTPSFTLAALTCFLAVAVEGAVYRENIFAAMKRIGSQQAMIERAIARRELTRITKLSENRQQHNKFLQDYFNQKNYLHNLEENLTYYGEQDKLVAKREIQRIKKRIEEMEDLFIEHIRRWEHSPNGVSMDQPILLEINDLLLLEDNMDCNTLEKEIKRKKRLMYASVIAAFAAGTCAGFVTLSSMQTCLVAAGMGLSAATVLAAPIIGFAALGYMLMMYRTVTDMIQNDTIQKWGKDLRQFWNTSKSERTASYYLKAVGVVALITLAIAATAATAGTWWYLAEKGAKVIKALPDLVIKISWGFTLIPTFFFNVVNALKSVDKIPGLIKGTLHNLSHDLRDTWKEENILQFLNPFRLIRKILNAAIFIGHLISMAVTADQTPGVNPIAATSANLMMESLVDLHYVVEDNHEKDHHYGDHASHDHHPEHPYSEAQHDEDHDHNHGDLFLNKINLFFNYITTAWDWLFSRNSWQTSKNKFFPLKNLPETKPLSLEWVEFEIGTQLDRKELEYQQKSPDKAKAFISLKTELVEIKPNPEDVKQNIIQEEMGNKIESAIAANQPLSQHRHSFRFFSDKPPASKGFLEEMLTDRSLQLRKGG